MLPDRDSPRKWQNRAKSETPFKRKKERLVYQKKICIVMVVMRVCVYKSIVSTVLLPEMAEPSGADIGYAQKLASYGLSEPS